MRKKSLIFLALLMTLGACNKVSTSSKAQERKQVDFDTLESNDYQQTPNNYQQIGEFELVAPYNGAILSELTTFSWNAAENAQRYKLEICSHRNFINDIDSIDYYCQDNINGLSWTPDVNLMLKNTTYYWRVTADNGRKQPKCCVEAFTFYIEAPEIEEFKFDLGEADDWQLHPTGSYADISVDNNDFFGNGEKSIVVSYKTEDTQRGIPESDGWIVVTKTIEKSIYGTDSLLFNMYYSGQEANIFIRLIDRDNEFWVCPVQVSNNAKQSIILKFSDFVQRTKDVTVANEVFDYERIKYFELVFEKSFGDGTLLISNVRAIKFDNYRDLFIEKLNFNDYAEDQWVNEGYQFEKEITDDELTIKFWGQNDQDKPSISPGGYGFAKINVGQYFYSGDSIKLKVKYHGNKGSYVTLRIYEEDKDRWYYRIPYSSLVEDEYSELVIPFAAFAKSSIQADGRRQFYYIINIQFGIEGQYGTGTASYKDFEIVKKKDYQTETRRAVDMSGVIDNFDTYSATKDMYFIWELTDVNKDEYMSLNTANKTGGSNNPFCGQFEYKADMEPALYELPVVTSESFSSFSIWMKDASIMDSNPRVSHLTNVSADVNIYIKLHTDEIYCYHLGYIEKTWTQYVIPFDRFVCSNADYIPHIISQITGVGIDKIGFTFQYYYEDVMGKPYPVYTDDNKVYIDNICFGHDTVYSQTLKEKVIHMDGNIALVDDFESYNNSDDLNDVWIDGRDFAYQHKELSNNVSSEGGNNSMSLTYKSNSDSPAYYISPAFDSDVKAKAVRFSLYSDKPAIIYFNLYFLIGTGTVQYRATLRNIAVGQWAEYAIGLSVFELISGNDITLNANHIQFISRISFGMAYYDGNYRQYQLLVDNLILDYSLSYNTNTMDNPRIIDGEQEEL